MKKTFATEIALTLLAGSMILFSSCQGVIFSTIRDEVELTDAQISGDINSIIRYTMNSKEYLFVQNGRVWKKDVTSADSGAYNGQWSETTKPDGYVYKLAADSTYLYALTVTFTEDEDDGENEPTARGLYYSTDGETWTENTNVTMSGTSYTALSALFCTNAPTSTHRSAYLNSAGVVYKLNGGDVTTIYDSSSVTTGDDVNHGCSASAISAAYFNGNVYFSSGNAMATNEVSSQYGSTAADASYIYYTSGSKIYYSNDTTNTDFASMTWSSVDPDTGTIYSLAVTSDSILFGTDEGIAKVSNSSGVPSSGTVDFSTNADSTLSSYYIIYALLALDQGKDETSCDIYGSTTFSGSSSSTSATFDNVGLWAYYPGRGNWNRE